MTVIWTGWVGLDGDKFFEIFDIFAIFLVKMKKFYITFAWFRLDWASLGRVLEITEVNHW